ncbi:hypothetical protein ACEWY4_009130 [Coilia grayii]|uniref:Gla domain-containing protein n=1 Tax=Coilia grayii TaxID=363190 RepID=A0ABD1K5V6_9TELE
MQSVCVVAQQTSFVASSRLISNGSSRSSAPTTSKSALWRPWLVTGDDSQMRCQRSKAVSPYSRPLLPGTTTVSSKLQPFQHPVRLFWPKSKSYDYLYSDGEALLKNFPVQATISFYEESDSDTDEEEEDYEEEDELMEAEQKVQSQEDVKSHPCFTHVSICQSELLSSMAAAFLDEKDAHSLLKRFPRANGFLEEFRQGSIERECVEESCSFEEANEVFENKERTMEFWKMRSIGSNAESRSDSKDVVFMVVPLLVMTLLALIGLFLLWRCQLQKTMRRRWPAYPQNRYLASRNSRSLPRILVHRDPPAQPPSSHPDNAHHYHHHHHHPAAASAPVLPEPSSCRPTVLISGAERGGGGGAGGGGGGRGSTSEHIQHPPNGHALYVKDSSASVASRLSGATPPPSYEEVTGHAESSSDETSAPYSDPPPKYDEIVKDR